MSVELHVYAPATAPLSPGQLAADAAAVNWHLVVVRDLESLDPAPTLDDCLIVGCEADSDTRPELDGRDRRRLEALYRNESLALVELRAEYPYAADPDDLVAWERAGVPGRHLRRVRAARVRYTLSTSASRNDLSEALQAQLWLLIGVLTDGLCEDPEQPEFVDPEAADHEPEP
ncbi:MAG TPA: hypothetical protein VFH97_05345 [Gemmatimonadales bacterium]|nr:hypothetical protein [Gemmatimonadales bacterium]